MTASGDSSAIRKRLRNELAAYLARPHRTKKHQEKARERVRTLFRQSRADKSDGWSRLEASDDSDGAFLSGSQLKGALRDQLVKHQGNRCCYCRRWLVNTAYARPIEHVLPRASYPQFSLHFWNLSVACTDCNAVKSDAVWGQVDPKKARYPLPGHIDDWFHPRFHTYDQHIRFVRLESNETTVIVYQAKTAQGLALCNSLLRHIAAREMVIAHNPTLKAFVETLNEHGDRFDAAKTEKLREFQHELNASVTRMIEV